MSSAEKNFIKAEKLREHGSFAPALKYYSLALKQKISPAAYFGLGGCLRLTGKFKEALKAYKNGLSLLSKDGAEYADGLMGLGMSLRGLSKYKAAEKYFKLAGKIYLKNRDEQGLAYCLWCSGGLLRILGKLKEGRACFGKSLSIYRKLKDESGTAYALAGTGGILRMLGEYKDSHECYRKAAGMFKKQKDTFGFAYCNCGMGSAARMSFKPEVSVEYYRIAVKNYRKITDEINIAFVLWGYANTLLTAGRLKEAEKLHRESAALFKKHDDKRGKVYAELQGGELERLKTNLPLAVKKFKSALKNARKFGFKFEALHAKTGLFYCGKGKETGREYSKIKSKWPDVLKRNTPVVLNFP